MDRRTVIKNLTILTAGVTLLPSCLQKQEKALVHLKNFSLKASQEKSIASVVDTIIPKTDSPGALALGVHLFVLKMVDECYSKKDQQNFIEGLDQLDEVMQKNYGHSFYECNIKQREDTLLALEQQKGFPTALITFYKILKYRTIQGFTTSKYVLSNELVYELVPGRYNGYFPVKVVNLPSKKNA